MSDLIPSSKPGHAWQFGVMRMSSGGIEAYAVEGESSVTPGGLHSFSYVMFQARRVRVPLAAKRLTAKVRAEGEAAIKAAVAEREAADDQVAQGPAVDQRAPLVQLVGMAQAIECGREEAVEKFAALGFAHDGESPKRTLRPELQGLPTFRGLAGPMWGGERNGQAVARYETWEANAALSA